MEPWMTFVLGILAILGIGFLIKYGIDKNRGASGSFAVGQLFKAEVKIEPEAVDRARKNVEEASKRRGGPGGAELAVSDQAIHLSRVLWVDDNPDNNVFEVIAAEELGMFVTVATTTDSATEYLEQMDFSLLVTDLTRHGDPNAGEALIKRLHEERPALPVIVYTGSADPFRNGLLKAGAKAVEDTPGDLLVAMQQYRTLHTDP